MYKKYEEKFNKIFKPNKKVELGIIQDLAGYTKSLQAMTKKMENLERQVKSVFSEIEKLQKEKEDTWDLVRTMSTQGDEQRREANKIADKIDKVNKELGIKVSIPEVQAYEKAKEEYNASRNDLLRLF